MTTTAYGGSIYLGRDLGWVKRMMRYSVCHMMNHGWRHGGNKCCAMAMEYDLDLHSRPDVERVFERIRANRSYAGWTGTNVRLQQIHEALLLWWDGLIPQPAEEEDRPPKAYARPALAYCSHHGENHPQFLCKQCEGQHGCSYDVPNCPFNPSEGGEWGTPIYEPEPFTRGDNDMANGLETHKLYECAAWNAETGEIYEEVDPRQTALNETMMKRKIITQLPEGAAEDPNVEITVRQLNPIQI